MREVVVNAGPLIHLASIGRFPLLQALFGCVNVPDAVFAEPELDKLLASGFRLSRTLYDRIRGAP